MHGPGSSPPCVTPTGLFTTATSPEPVLSAVRHALAEAAQVAIRKEPYHSDHLATKQRRGTGIALVRVSRKLLTEAFYVLKALEDEQRQCS